MKKRILLVALLALGITAYSQTAKEVPYVMNFEDDTEFYSDGWTFEDGNADNHLWMIADASSDMCGTGDGMMFMDSGMSGDNDWIFTPPLSLQAGTTYYVNFTYSIYYGDQTSFEVKWGTSNASSEMTNSLANFEDYNNGSCTDAASSSSFTAPSTGIYYIGFRAYHSNMESSPQVFDDFSIALTPENAINENESSTTLSIYPNPATSTITIHTKAGSMINIYNAMGELVYSKKDATDNENIDITGIANGIYVIHVIQDNILMSKQIEVIN